MTETRTCVYCGDEITGEFAEHTEYCCEPCAERDADDWQAPADTESLDAPWWEGR
jgi:hypothetical protein